ncbi:DUF7093 family protein [Haloparvum sp. PAK95]|uniref:DUF7093 family protein n=1 Tax=Haloparvum sp. PAK95 TaxID=3418962 RepID=UPI003D2EB4D1
MGLRCLLGHNFGEPEVERDREEDGNEVVITVREVKECTRCGDQQVVSENKEITSLDQLTDEAAVAEEEAEAGRTGAERTDPGPDAETGPGSAPGTADAAEPRGEAFVEDAEGDATADAGVTVDPSDDLDASDPPAEGAGAEIIDDGPADGAPSEPEPTVDLSEAAEGGDPTEPSPAAGSGQKEGRAPTDGEDEAEIIDETTTAETGVDDTADPETVADEVPGGSEAAPETDPDADDGVILDEEPEEPADRDPGEWPDVEADQPGSGEHSPWPEQRGEDEGFDATVDDDTDADVSFGGGLKPEAAETDDVDEDAEFIETPEEAEGGFIATAEESAAVEGPASSGTNASNAAGDATSARRGDLGGTTADELSEYYCPECGLAEIAGDSSMRAGDICPECKRGYVAERPAE